MIPAEIEKVGGGHFRQVRERGIAADGDLGRRHGGFQERRLTESLRAAEALQGGGMDLLHDLHREVEAVLRRDLHASLRMVRA